VTANRLLVLKRMVCSFSAFWKTLWGLRKISGDAVVVSHQTVIFSD